MAGTSSRCWTSARSRCPPLDQVKPQLTNLVLQDEERKVLEGLHKDAKIEHFNPDGTPMTDKPAATDTPTSDRSGHSCGSGSGSRRRTGDGCYRPRPPSK